MAQDSRPISPHLSVYRWQISNSLSIVHRFTGVMLSLGALALVGWLVSVASGYNAYASVSGLFSGIPGNLLLLGWSFCFFYHLANGIRHLAWDAGYGFERRLASQTGVLVIIVAVALTAGFWAVMLFGG